MIEELKKIFKNLKSGIIDKEVISFTDYKNKYVHLRPRVIVTAEFTDGKEAKVDVTDYFKEVVK